MSLVGGAVLVSSLVLSGPGLAGTDGGDDVFLRVWQVVPEFGGAWVQDDAAHIWITKDSHSVLDEARRALINLVGSDFNTPRASKHIARYTFKQLYDWHIAARDVLNVDDVIFSDIDERRNRLAIGTVDPDLQRQKIEHELTIARVPIEAVTILKASPIRQIRGQSRLAALGILGALLIGLAMFTLIRRGRSRHALEAHTPLAVQPGDPE